MVLFFLSIFIYCNSLNGGFTYDDMRTVVENTYLDSFDTIIDIFTTMSFWGSNSASRAYRPITTFFYLCINVIFGKNPFWFHLCNVFINAINVVLLFSFLNKFISRHISFASALLFCLHPIHTEAVANITGLAELLSTMFFFLSFGFLMQCKEKISWHILPSAPFLFLGLLSKENVAVLPFIYILYLILFVDVKKPWFKKLYQHTWCIIIPFITVGIFILIRSQIVGGLLGLHDINYYDNFIPHLSFINGRLSAIKVVGMYIYKFIFPLNLLADYSFPIVRPVVTIFNLRFVFYLFYFLVCLIPVFAVKNTYIRFGACFFFICISMVNNFFFPIGTIMGERLLYLPSVGLSLLLATTLFFISENIFQHGAFRNRFYWSIIFILGGAFGTKTIARNKDWSTSFSLWNSTIKTTRLSFRAYNNRANCYIDMKEFTRARSDLFKSLAINTKNHSTYYTIGRTFDGENSLDSAIYYYSQAITIKPYDYRSRVNRGIDLMIQKKFRSAIKDFEICTKIDPAKFYPWHNLAISHLELGEYDKSIIANKKALVINPDNIQAQIIKGRIYLANENYLKAEEIFLNIPESAETLYYAGYAYLKNGKKEKAVESLKKSIRLYPAVRKTIMESEEFQDVWNLLE